MEKREDSRKSNPRAAQVRIKSASRASYLFQRKHDARKGKQPDYVDAARADENDLLIASPTPEAMKAVNEERRAKRETKRAMRSDASIAFHGILTFGTEAQAMFEALTREDQNAAFRDAAEAVAERLKTTLAGLVVHRDETAVHAHFTLPAYDMDGNPLTFPVRSRLAFQAFDATGKGGSAGGATRTVCAHRGVKPSNRATARCAFSSER